MFSAGSPPESIPPALCRLFALFCLLGALRLLAGVFVPAWRPRGRWQGGRKILGAAVPLSALALAGMIPFQLALGLLALTEGGDVPAWQPWRVKAMVLGCVLLAAALVYEWFRTSNQAVTAARPTPALERTPTGDDAGFGSSVRPPQ